MHFKQTGVHSAVGVYVLRATLGTLTQTVIRADTDIGIGELDLPSVMRASRQPISSQFCLYIAPLFCSMRSVYNTLY